MDPNLAQVENRLERLIARLLAGAEAAFLAGDIESARASAEEVRAVSPEDRGAIDLLERVSRSQRPPEGERVLMTVLFSDLVDSTALAERVDPEVVRDILMAYRGTATTAVERFGGLVLQWLGDGVLAVFGYQQVFEDDARRAVSAALDLVESWAGVRSNVQERFGVEPQLRVGVHTGVVVVAEVGEPTGGERNSIVGAAPNLAARIQGEAAPGTVVITDVTQYLVDADFYLRSLGLRDLKGVPRQVEVFTVDGPRHTGARLDSERYRRRGLVGRDQPRACLVDAWEKVRLAAGSTSGAGSAAVITGEAGIGKSRLAADIREHVAKGGGQTFETGCLAYNVNISLWPIRRLMERVIAEDAPEHEDAIAHLIDHLRRIGMDIATVVPLFAPLLGRVDPAGYPAPELDPVALLDRTLGRLVDWLGRLAGEQPALLILEDLHWADPSTRQLLDRLVGAVPSGLLAIVTTRDPDAFGGGNELIRVGLDRLSEQAAASLVDQVASGKDLSPETRASIISRGEGIPLFIEELARSASMSDGSGALPLRLHELFTGRLRAAGLDLRVAQVAATIGAAFDASTVAAVMDDPDRVAGSLEGLDAAGIVEPTGDLLLAGGYRFHHALVRDAAYDTQVREVRLETHGVVAKQLRAAGADPALVAQHYDLAEDIEQAVPEYLMAAQGAQGRGAHPEAIHILTRVVELLEPSPPGVDRDVRLLTSRLLRALSISAIDGYAATGVLADHAEVETLVERLDDRPEVLPAVLAMWVTAFARGDLAVSRRLSARLLRMVSSPMFSWFEPEARTAAGFESLHQGHIGDAQAHLERAMEGYDQRPDGQKVSFFWPLPHDPVVVALAGLVAASLLQGDNAAAEQWESSASRRAEEIGFPSRPVSRIFLRVYRAWPRRLFGDDEAARRLGSEILAIAREHGLSYWERFGCVYQAAPDVELEPMAAFVEQAITELLAMGHELGVNGDLGHLSRLQAGEGRVAEALETVERAIGMARGSGELVQLPELLRLQARYMGRLTSGAEEVPALLLTALQQAESQGSPPLALRIARDIAALPPDFRPENWNALLEAAQARLAETH